MGANLETVLDTAAGSGATTFSADTTGMPSVGVLWAVNAGEAVVYRSITASSFDSLERGAIGTTPAALSVGERLVLMQNVRGKAVATVGGSPHAVVPGTVTINWRQGDGASVLSFRSTAEPALYGDLAFSIQWYDPESGETFVTELVFGGKVVEALPIYLGPNKIDWEVTCYSHEWLAARQIPEFEIGRQSISNLFDSVVSDYLAGDGFTANNLPGGTVSSGGYFRDRDTVTSLLDSFARDGAMLWEIDPSKNVRPFDPGSEKVPWRFDMDVDYTGISTMRVSKSVTRLVTVGIGHNTKGKRIVVEKNDGFTAVDFEQYVAVHDLENTGDVTRVITARVNSRKNIVVSGQVISHLPFAKLNRTVQLYSADRGFTGETVYITGMISSQMKSERWSHNLSVTSESPVDRAVAFMERERLWKEWVERNKEDDDPKDKTTDAPSPPSGGGGGGIPGPDDDQNATGGGAIRFHQRFNRNTGQLRIKFDSSYTNAADALLFNVAVQFNLPEAKTIATSINNPGTGYGIAVSDNGTRKPSIKLTVNGKVARWSILNQSREIVLDVGALTKKGGTFTVAFRNLNGPDIDDVSFGKKNVASDVPSGAAFVRTYDFLVQVDNDQVADGKIDKQLAGGDNISAVFADDGSTPLIQNSGSTRRIKPSLSQEDSGSNVRTQDQIRDRIDRADAVLTTAGDGVKDNQKLGSGGLRVRSGGGLGTSTKEAVDTGGRHVGEINDAGQVRTVAQLRDRTDRADAVTTASGNVAPTAKVGDTGDAMSSVEDGSARGRSGLASNGDVTRNIVSGGSTLLSLNLGQLQNTDVVNSSRIGGTSAMTTNKVRAGATRGITFLDGDGTLFGLITRGSTGAKRGTSVWGIDVPTSPGTISTSSGVGSSTDTGDSGGEGKIEV